MTTTVQEKQPDRVNKNLARQTKESCSVAIKPRTDVHESPSAFLLVADLPGVSKDDIHIDVGDRVLTIEGAVTPEDERWGQSLQARRPPRFWRQFRLGQNIDVQGIDAKLEDGVLTVRLPKDAKACTRKIEVQVQGAN